MSAACPQSVPGAPVQGAPLPVLGINHVPGTSAFMRLMPTTGQPVKHGNTINIGTAQAGIDVTVVVTAYDSFMNDNVAAFLNLSCAGLSLESAVSALSRGRPETAAAVATSMGVFVGYFATDAEARAWVQSASFDGAPAQMRAGAPAQMVTGAPATCPPSVNGNTHVPLYVFNAAGPGKMHPSMHLPGDTGLHLANNTLDSLGIVPVVDKVVVHVDDGQASTTLSSECIATNPSYTTTGKLSNGCVAAMVVSASAVSVGYFASTADATAWTKSAMYQDFPLFPAPSPCPAGAPGAPAHGASLPITAYNAGELGDVVNFDFLKNGGWFRHGKTSALGTFKVGSRVNITSDVQVAASQSLASMTILSVPCAGTAFMSAVQVSTGNPGAFGMVSTSKGIGVAYFASIGDARMWVQSCSFDKAPLNPIHATGRILPTVSVSKTEANHTALYVSLGVLGAAVLGVIVWMVVKYRKSETGAGGGRGRLELDAPVRRTRPASAWRGKPTGTWAQ